MLISTITGNVGRDPEMVTEPFEQVKISVAVKVGHKEPKTVWHNLSIAAGGKAKFIYQYVKKGDKVHCVVDVRSFQVNGDTINVYGRIIDLDKSKSTDGSGDFSSDMPF